MSSTFTDKVSFRYLQYRVTRHLNEANQGYFEHLSDSWGYAAKTSLASLSFFVHGLLPFTFEHTGSDHLKAVHDKVASKLASMKKDDIPSPSSPPSST